MEYGTERRRISYYINCTVCNAIKFFAWRQKISYPKKRRRRNLTEEIRMRPKKISLCKEKINLRIISLFLCAFASYFLFKCWVFYRNIWLHEPVFLRKFWNEIEDISVSLDKTFSVAFPSRTFIGWSKLSIFLLNKGFRYFVQCLMFEERVNCLIQPVGMWYVLQIKLLCH